MGFFEVKHQQRWNVFSGFNGKSHGIHQLVSGFNGIHQLVSGDFKKVMVNQCESVDFGVPKVFRQTQKFPLGNHGSFILDLFKNWGPARVALNMEGVR
jgi:hypothetical protein